jgi:hypothetical protein
VAKDEGALLLVVGVGDPESVGRIGDRGFVSIDAPFLPVKFLPVIDSSLYLIECKRRRRQPAKNIMLSNPLRPSFL